MAQSKVKVAGGSPLWIRPEFVVIPFCPGCQEPIVGQIVLEVLVAAEGVVMRERKGRALLWEGKSLEDIERQLGVG